MMTFRYLASSRRSVSWGAARKTREKKIGRNAFFRRASSLRFRSAFFFPCAPTNWRPQNIRNPTPRIQAHGLSKVNRLSSLLLFFFIYYWSIGIFLGYAGGIWKGSFISPVRSTVHTNPSQKRNFSKMLFKPEELKTPANRFRKNGKHFKNEALRV